MPRKKKSLEVVKPTIYYVVRRGIITESDDYEHDVIRDQIIPLYCESLEQAKFAKTVYFALLMTSHALLLDPPEIENLHLAGYYPIDETVSVLKHILKDDNFFHEAIWIEEFNFDER